MKMKITKTVGQCPFCEINEEELDSSINKDSPVVSIYRRIINDDGSVETLNDFEIFADGTINVATYAILDYNMKIVNRLTDITYLQIVDNIAGFCKLYSDIKHKGNRSDLLDMTKKSILRGVNFIKESPIQHNIVQIGEDEEISVAMNIIFDGSNHTLTLQKSECNDNFCKIEGDDRFVFGKVILGNENGFPEGYILNDGGIIFDSNKTLNVFTFSEIVDKVTVIGRRKYLGIDIPIIINPNTFNDHIADIISYETRKEQ